MRSPVYIHGMGLITPLGRTLPETFAGIMAGRRVTDAGVVPDHFLELAARQIARRNGNCGLPENLDRSIQLGLHAAFAACDAAEWPAEVLSAEDTGIFAATSKGPAIAWLAALDAIRRPGGSELNFGQAWHAAMGTGAMGTALGALLGCRGPVHTTVAACAGGLAAVHRAVQALNAGDCRRALVAAADSSLHSLFEGCYDNLGVLAAREPDGHRRCHPLAGGAGGFVVSQAGAAVLLSAEKPRDITVAAMTIEATWLGAEGLHIVGADPRGTRLAEGINAVRCVHKSDPARILFVHAHAAGTQHDAVELRAIQKVLDGVPVFSHKQWLGHSLGASGLAGLTLSAECHRQGRTLTGEILGGAGDSIIIAQGFGGHIGICRLACGRQPA